MRKHCRCYDHNVRLGNIGTDGNVGVSRNVSVLRSQDYFWAQDATYGLKLVTRG